MFALVLALTPTAPAPADDATSLVGRKAGPYSFLVATGAQRGQPTCYVCDQADKPTAVVFVRTLSDPAGKLMSKLDAEVTARKEAGFKAWLTHLTATADLDALAKWSQKQGLKGCPVGAFEDADGPPAYKLTKDADVTVVLFVKQRVTAAYAFKAGDLTDAKIDEVVTAVGPLCGPK